MKQLPWPAKTTLLLLWWAAALGAAAAKPVPTPLRLWYTQPAANWNEALPLGNGRLGAMVFGAPQRERLQLNEETIWAGGPNNNVKPDALPVVRQLREQLLAGQLVEAQALAQAQMQPAGNSGMPYQTASNVYLDFPGHEGATHYQRDLDIGRAVASVSYQVGRVRYRREVFSSLPDQVVVVRLTASKPGQISCQLSEESLLPFTRHAEKDQLVLDGHGSAHEGQEGQIRFQTRLKAVVEGGTVQTTDAGIRIQRANSATLYLSIGTNFNNYHDVSGDAAARASAYLAAAVRKPYKQALADHVAAYQRYFNRVTLNLGVTPAVQLPTLQRLADFAQGHDPALAALYFQYGRYLLISSSQPGGQPANLQGIWNDQLKGPWDSKYTVNINTEMNYWPAEVTNLTELHEPLFSLIQDLSVTGRQSARQMYGARGWMLHHNTDIWRITGQVDPPQYGLWPMGGAWLSQHLWDHYQFTGDQQFLRTYYPVLKGAATYYVDALQEEPTHHWLVVAPSVSPENTYSLQGKQIALVAGTTMDNQLVFDLFSKTIRAAELLQLDQPFADTLRTLRERLPPMQIGQYGQVQEWLQDVDNPRDTHRHISHLYGLYPSGQLSPYRTPALFEAARVTLTQRGDVSTGWSMGWKVNFWARMQDGNHAYKLLTEQLRLRASEPGGVSEGGGTYPNLLDAHPPFQIDGNFGCTAGLAELFVQSYDGTLDLLPALPDAWPTGEVTGLVARGGYVVDLAWDKGRLTRARITSRLGGNCRVRVHRPIAATGGLKLQAAQGPNSNPFYQTFPVKPPLVSAKTTPRQPALAPSFVYDFPTQAGQAYSLRAR
ncbi:glycoside hydrolase family 95 protein [Hymenobacter jejuensis]|uniref:Glycoside hydrolase family 95 protein n=1 Tax=Hymenobacter jejuensis TaxID=2502781 RepID=A0A5B8A1Y7_9BACT|nr:glycoside hydrolase family 95 protein [Hymenobacter jejuensis]QDA60685.1 glycoside hydrolase family 95 protein [Hymenobacter jejuensis]